MGATTFPCWNDYIYDYVYIDIKGYNIWIYTIKLHNMLILMCFNTDKK